MKRIIKNIENNKNPKNIYFLLSLSSYMSGIYLFEINIFQFLKYNRTLYHISMIYHMEILYFIQSNKHNS